MEKNELKDNLDIPRIHSENKKEINSHQELSHSSFKNDLLKNKIDENYFSVFFSII